MIGEATKIGHELEKSIADVVIVKGQASSPCRPSLTFNLILRSRESRDLRGAVEILQACHCVHAALRDNMVSKARKKKIRALILTIRRNPLSEFLNF